MSSYSTHAHGSEGGAEFGRATPGPVVHLGRQGKAVRFATRAARRNAPSAPCLTGHHVALDVVEARLARTLAELDLPWPTVVELIVRRGARLDALGKPGPGKAGPARPDRAAVRIAAGVDRAEASRRSLVLGNR
uniref:Uncharacterized protein n=1 Tax=Anopheles coluzzii TaxID=1518534 RepID=A0A8W7PZZ8_ANOCL